MKRTLTLLVVLAVVAGISVGGYLVGHSRAPTGADAGGAKANTRVAAHELAYRKAFDTSRGVAYETGVKEGRDRGRRLGRKLGTRDGESEVARRTAALAEDAANSRLATIRNRANERAKNCGAPLFVDGYCPTDAEIEQENNAESLCGPGTVEGKREAARLGIQC